VDANYDKAGDITFRRLAGYIFGDNASRAKIRMATPVTQERTSEKIPVAAPVGRRSAAHC